MYENTRNIEEAISMSVLSGGSSPEIVSDQPTFREQERSALQGTRRPIPISTIDWTSTVTSHFSPLHGLDFLHDTNQLIVQQTVELTDLMSNLASENRYTVKVPRGETIFYATESSTSFQRTCFGSSRSFSMRLFDASQQEAIQFKRRLGCGSCCSIFCYLQEMEVWIPPGELLGTIRQNFDASRPNFSVCNRHNETVYRVEGPESFMGCLLGKNHNFQIFSGDGATQLGSIIHQWDQIQADYNLYLQLPGNDPSTRNKALLLGAAFLLEYMYFESSKRGSGLKCIC